MSTGKLARQISRQIDKELKKEKEARDKDPSIKLLCLGAAESGKSTIIKQLHLLQGTGFPQERKPIWAAVIWYYIVKHGKELAAFLEKTVPPKDKLMESVELILSLPDIVEPRSPLEINNDDIKNQVPVAIDVTVVEAISAMWQHQKPLDKIRFANHSSATYFLDNLHRISPGYIPTEEDILLARSPTKQVQSYKFVIDSVAYRVFDVGGSRSQRHHWASYFDDALSIIFVADISAYSRTLEEDPAVNRLVDSLELFDSIINHPLFVKMDIILFLNKVDLLETELQRIPISTFVPAYDGPNEVKPVTRMLKSMYNRLNKSKPEDRSIFIHMTHATDTKAMKVIWAATTLIIVRMNVKSSGYV